MTFSNPFSNHNNHERDKSKQQHVLPLHTNPLNSIITSSRCNRRVFLGLIVSSILVLGFYSSHINLDHLTHHLRPVASFEDNNNSSLTRPRFESERWPNCPIPIQSRVNYKDSDFCVHQSVDLSRLASICGNVNVWTGMCRDQVYETILTTVAALHEVSHHTDRMVVQTPLRNSKNTATAAPTSTNTGEQLDLFVQQRSRWIIDLVGWDRAGGSSTGGEDDQFFEILTSPWQTKRLQLQQNLNRLQYQECERFFYGAISPNGHGMGSNWHNLALGLAHAQVHNNTLYTPHPYTHFIRTTSCTEQQLNKAFERSEPLTDYRLWNETTVNFKSIRGEDVTDLAKNSGTIMKEYESMGHFWWRSILTYYAVRPNAMMREVFRQSASPMIMKTADWNLKNQKVLEEGKEAMEEKQAHDRTAGTNDDQSMVQYPMVPAPARCISIHVRHSDKYMEATLVEFPAYMEHAIKYREKTGVSNIYLLTDDDAVVQATKNYPDFKFYYLDIPRSNKGWWTDLENGVVSRDYQERRFLVDLYSAARCEHRIVTYSSNVGRLISEIAYALEDREPSVVSLDVGWKMDP
ncbi:hypothetical protein EDD11_009344 [Mortierella claussenii]|nr:hypothetical protein EDD11_009344 [Mortierella claussenii]